MLARPLLFLLVLIPFSWAMAQEAAGDAMCQRFLSRFQTMPGAARQPARLLFDGRPVLTLPAKDLSCAMEGTARKPVLVVRSDGVETTRLALPRLDLQLKDLPPLAVPDLDAVTMKSESRTVNGVSTTRVWLDGRLVYEGPGARSQTSTSSVNGRRSASVTVDGHVVYRIGEGQGAPSSAMAP